MTDGDQHVGATIAGKYRIRRLIGVGGMGYVYEGEHVDLGKRVAIKIIDGAGDTSAELATRFRREARAASAVESDGIVQVFDVGRDPSVGLFMVMELLQGEDLENRLRKEPGRKLEPALVAQIGYQVSRALVKAHASRVIHRDLKPANIFLTDRDDGSLRVKILDFGISKLLASEASIATSKDGLLGLTQAGVALGTPQYMSPEQAQGLTTVDHRCDVWGLGVVLYEALAGVPAFPELKTYHLTILNMLHNPPPPLSRVAPWVPEALANVVHAAIQHDVAARIQSCALLATRLEEAMPEVAIAGTGPFASVRMPRLSSPSHSAYAVSVAKIASAPTTPAPNQAKSAPRPGDSKGANADVLSARRPIEGKEAKGESVAALSARRPIDSKAESAARPASFETARQGSPITLGDDTQVVVRTNDPAATFDDDDPSMTMLASDSARAASLPRPAPRPPSSVGGDELHATGDPTMFQSPAWVAQPDEGPGTLKTGVALAGVLPTPGSRAARQVIAAMMTALVVVVVGGSLLLLAQRESPSDASSAAGAATSSTGPVESPLEMAPAAPPPTGTTAIPRPPSTGSAAANDKPDAPSSPAR
jgi:serine/threonine protein kinase